MFAGLGVGGLLLGGQQEDLAALAIDVQLLHSEPVLDEVLPEETMGLLDHLERLLGEFPVK